MEVIITQTDKNTGAGDRGEFWFEKFSKKSMDVFKKFQVQVKSK